MAMESLNEMFFTSSVSEDMTYDQILEDVCLQQLPVVFAIWVMVEGVIIAVQSFDYKKVGYQYWWALLVLGVAGAVFGFLGLKNLDVAAVTLSTLIGIGIIANGLAYICAVIGVNRFEKEVENFKEAVREAIEEQ